MPTTENDRRNLQQPVLENPSLPEFDRRRQPGMHEAQPHSPPAEPIEFEFEEELAAPDQEFQQILQSGTDSNLGRIPEDPNNSLTSDPEAGTDEHDPENRGESHPDLIEKLQH